MISAKEKKIELFGERLLAVKEVARRDLSKVPTTKLFDMMIKCQAALEKENFNLGLITDE